MPATDLLEIHEDRLARLDDNVAHLSAQVAVQSERSLYASEKLTDLDHKVGRGFEMLSEKLDEHAKTMASFSTRVQDIEDIEGTRQEKRKTRKVWLRGVSATLVSAAIVAVCKLIFGN